MNRANYLPAPHMFNLNQACVPLHEAFRDSGGVYLVGSAIKTREYRDVDVRLILSDADFERLFPRVRGHNPRVSALWSIMCASISLWLSQHSGLPVDFQIQQQTAANKENDGPREPLGFFIHEDDRLPHTSERPESQELRK